MQKVCDGVRKKTARGGGHRHPKRTFSSRQAGSQKCATRTGTGGLAQLLNSRLEDGNAWVMLKVEL